MKWKKLGKIFDPTEHKLANNCVEFAQSPQSLVFDDFVRIYFSTRQKDSKGKYISHVSFVEFDKKFKKIKNISKHTIIDRGELGCFDEHGIFPFNIFRDEKRILGYIGGWSRRVSVPIETSIGLSISINDGRTFKRIGNGPVLTSSLAEPFMVGDPFVQKYNGLFHMWYIYGTKWIESPQEKESQRVYKIAHAISKDGVSWEKENRQIISDTLNNKECQALPTVIAIGKRYHMFFCYREAIDFRKNKKRAYRIGYAFSNDLKNWIRDDSQAGIDISENGWDSDMLCYPHIFKCNNDIYLLYNGNEFGRFGFGIAILQN